MRGFQAKLSLRLLVWSIFSIVTSLFVWRLSPFWKGIATQFVAWGTIDALIAVGGQVASNRRLNKTAAEDLPAQLEKDKRNLKIALWVNTGLDVLYMAIGIRGMQAKQNDPYQRGNGLGVLIQGAFLFVFDLYHALKLDSVVNDDPSNNDQNSQ